MFDKEDAALCSLQRGVFLFCKEFIFARRSTFHDCDIKPASVLVQLRDAKSGQVLQTIRREYAADAGNSTDAVFSLDGKAVALTETGLENAVKIVHLTGK